MVKIPLKTIYLCVCAVEMLWLLLAQALGNIVLLLPCLACFLIVIAGAALQGIAMPVLLFFLPFAPLLKMAPGSISFYTLALLVVYFIYAVKGSRNIPIFHLIPGVCLLMLTLVVKITAGISIDNAYILFCISLLLVPFLALELGEKCDFYWVTVFFVCGIIMAAVTARFMASIPTIARYIDINVNLGFARRSGYYGDPNFYSSHITAALGGLLVLLMQNLSKIKRAILVAMAIVLIYCGLMSVSKSFLLVSLSLLLFWFVGFMFRRGKMSAKLAMLITVLIAAVFLLSSTVFQDMLDVMLSRFVGNSNLSAFTTKRVDLWVNYFNAFREDASLLLFGKGFSNILLYGRGSHNTLIQCVYQFGLFGTVFLAAWAIFFVRTMMMRRSARGIEIAPIAILVLGAFGPWLGLDFLFLDEFFLLPIYVCAAVRFLNDQREQSLSAAEEM